jgi:hypothetical protein
MVSDCIRYQRGCEACQKSGIMQSVPASMLHPIVKPWPFRGWGLDFFREVHPVQGASIYLGCHMLLY